MTQDEKILLIKVLAEQSPYGLKVSKGNNIRRSVRTVSGVDTANDIVHFKENDTVSQFGVDIEHPLTFRQYVKPFLRPLSSMTDTEETEYNKFFEKDVMDVRRYLVPDYIDWLNAHHFDWRGLIQKGLATEAIEGMYN